jgi:hypothetical protein
MTWRDGMIILLVWLAIGMIACPYIGEAIKTMRGDEE